MASIFSKLGKWLPVGKVEEIDPHELNSLLKKHHNIQLLDVRTSVEWKAGHIEGAVNIPLIELPKRINQLDFEKDMLVVPICLSAHRSIPAVRLLKEKGFSDVRQLAGGMKRWNRHYKNELIKKS